MNNKNKNKKKCGNKMQWYHFLVRFEVLEFSFWTTSTIVKPIRFVGAVFNCVFFFSISSLRSQIRVSSAEYSERLFLSNFGIGVERVLKSCSLCFCNDEFFWSQSKIS